MLKLRHLFALIGIAVVAFAAKIEHVEFDLNDPRHPKNVHRANNIFDRRERRLGTYNAGEGALMDVNGKAIGVGKYNDIADPKNKRVEGNGHHAVVPGKLGVNSPVAGVSPNDYYAHLARRDEHFAQMLHKDRRSKQSVAVKVVGDDDAAKIADLVAANEMGDGGRDEEKYLSLRMRKERQAKSDASRKRADATNFEPPLPPSSRAPLDAQHVVRRAKYSCRQDVLRYCVSEEDVLLDKALAKADPGLADSHVRLRKRIQTFETCLSKPKTMSNIGNPHCKKYIHDRSKCLAAAKNAKDVLCHIYIDNRTAYLQAKHDLDTAESPTSAPGVCACDLG